MASTPQEIDVGCIVRTTGGYDGVVVEKFPLEDGHYAYDIFLIDAEETLHLNYRQVEFVDTLDVQVSIEVDAPVISTDQAPVSSVPSTVSTGRFATIETDEDIDKLADSRLSKNTKRQTAWAVRVFRGELICFDYLYFARHDKPRPLQSRRAVNQFPT